jgi:hypothetical protein
LLKIVLDNKKHNIELVTWKHVKNKLRKNKQMFIHWPYSGGKIVVRDIGVDYSGNLLGPACLWAWGV